MMVVPGVGVVMVVLVEVAIVVVNEDDVSLQGQSRAGDHEGDG
jgi:hypothetical protein